MTASVVQNDVTPKAVREPLPAYVADALKGLTRAQKRFVLAGCIHGDFQMQTVRELKRKALFYLHPTSPNGRYGEMRLTPLGETVRTTLQQREAPHA